MLTGRTEDFEAALRPNTRMLYLETPSNPLISVLDIEATCEKNAKHYKHEVIEFPVVVLDLEKGGVRLHLDANLAAPKDPSGGVPASGT